MNRKRKQLNGAALNEDFERAERQWVLTPDGPAKIWGFLPDGRVGIVLRSDILARIEGERPVRFCQGSQVWPWTEGDLIFCEPLPDPDEGKWRAVATDEI